MIPENLADQRWRLAALRLAMKTAPWSSRHIGPEYDHQWQRLSLRSMESSLDDQARRAKEKIMSAPAQWATTGHWPRIRNAAALFLREAIQGALDEFDADVLLNTRGDCIAVPPWSKDAASWLNATTTEEFYSRRIRPWAQNMAKDAFDLQESSFQSDFPFE